MTRAIAAGLLAVLLSGTAQADTVSSTDPAFAAELRAALLADPEPIWRAFNPPAPSDRENIDRDLARLAAAAGQLFDPDATMIGSPGSKHPLALFVRPGCPDCEKAKNDLKDLAAVIDLRVTFIDITRQAGLADRIGVDMAPSYVLPDMIVRGHVPAVVIRKYLSK
ncbi:thioredoxin family protein [Thalassovita sp.]|uniref:thioredoxin family protein n=1 Tax=Thalassovita sp. TaxID=1979401 RepID=UPI002B270054|nr:thioredoxin family protein [Thalassovita sp.]